jgi:hypothetical protein
MPHVNNSTNPICNISMLRYTLTIRLELDLKAALVSYLDNLDFNSIVIMGTTKSM